MPQSTFVLVHGAWHGGWCWKRVTPILQAAGYSVFTPTLTGLGERAHLLHPGINLDTHIQDITALLEYEDLHNVVLVGHSYGGMVITGVAEKACERLSHLVYLDAFLPENGKSVSDYGPLAPAREDGWRIPTPGNFGVNDERDLTWMTPRLRDQPIQTFTQIVQLSPGHTNSLTKAYIQCTQGFLEAGERARQQGFRYFELFSAGHDAMVTQPEELVKILIAIV